MNRRISITLFTAVLLLFASCKSQYEVLLSSNDVDAKYKAAMDYFHAKRYMRAAQLFMASSAFSTLMTYLPSWLRVKAPLSCR